MQYHLDTIPVWEAMEKQTPCPLCYLYQKTERAEVERSLGGSVMEPEARIRVNETGICAEHHRQLFLLQNRLGHALLTDSHSKELLKKLDKLEKQAANVGGKGLFAKSDALEGIVKALEGYGTGCVICENTRAHMERYLYTFVQLWKTDEKFQTAWESARGVCLPHARELLSMAGKHLNGDKLRAFAQSVLVQLKNGLAEDEKDLEWFTLKFDYRNQQKPWGNSKNALERTVNRLRGRCLGEREE